MFNTINTHYAEQYEPKQVDDELDDELQDFILAGGNDEEKDADEVHVLHT